jgi:flagellar hook-associated protein 3 FlgL
MRVTEKMVFENSLAQTERSRENMDKAQNEVGSGKRVEHPGDDPAAAALAVGHSVDQARFAAVGKNAQQAADELNQADTALEGIGTAASRALQLATQFGNDSYGATDRASGAQAIDGILQQTVGLLNTTYSGRYIFGGSKDGSVPFDASGNYLGDSVARSVEVAPGLYQTSSLDANTLVKGGGTGVDFLKTLSDLSTALKNNDGDAIRSSIGNINTAINQINAGRTQAGMGVDAFQAAVSTADAAVSDETVRIGKLMDADIIDATTRLTSAQYALNATLTAAAKTMNMSLVDKLSN